MYSLVPSDRFQGRRSALAARIASHPLAARLTRTALHTRFTWYALGSVVAFIASNMVFLALYLTSASTTVCSVGGFVAGAIPNWILNRRWAWRRSGRPVFGREIVGYILVSIVVLVTTSAATGWTDAQVQSIPPHHGIRALLVTASYVAVTAILFVAKFAIYEYWVFSDRSRVRAAFRSLRHVPRTARANRIP
jgi:putative flippase GtrA